MTDFELISTLKRKEAELNKLKEKLESHTRSVPEGILKFETRKNGKTYYYFVPADDGKKSYIRKSELAKASAFAQRDYEKKGRLLINNLSEAIGQCIECISLNSLEKYYDNLAPERKSLIRPLSYNKESFIQKWENVSYDPKPFLEDAPIHTTDRGERVRSKSEVLIANALFRREIPYRYEYPLNINGFEYRPDFTILNPYTGKEFIWEHFGMMDDIAYCEEAIRKLSIFQENNILPGKKLIATFESRRNPLNKIIIENTIREYFLK